jgi:PAS domain S-box-containing protein
MATKSIPIERLDKERQALPIGWQEVAQALLHSSGLGIYIVQEGKFQYVNPVFQNLTGYTEKELLGKYSLDFVHPEDREMVRKKAIENLKSKKGSIPYEYRFVKKNGEIIWVLEEVTPINFEGKRATVGTFMDITDRKRLQGAVSYSEKSYRTIIDAIHDAYFEVDLGGTFTFVNDQMSQIFQYSKEELLGMNYKTFTPEEDIKNVYAIYNEVYRTGQPILSYGHRVIRKDGTSGFSDVSISPLKNAKGEIIGFRGISRDITARKRLEEEREALLQEIRKINRKLEEANKELQDFVYIASHDLREPLRKISSFGTLLQDSLKGKLNEDQQENFEFMIDGSRRMQDMIDALLIYSRLTTKAKPFEWVDLNKIIEDLKKLELATMLAETGGIIHVPEPLPSIQADRSQMHQLFQNLIGNGLKFRKDGMRPEVIIRAHEIDLDMIRIEVEDNGIGIDDKYQGQLFTMFKRLHSRDEYEGTGIGLASCKKIVERHGGNIGIKSTPGKGSTFWFTLPREKYLK